jgi:hypothetical protein
MLLALVVSVVADVANPETAPEEIAIDVAVTEVTLPKESTDIAGTADADPYVPADTPEVGSLADGSVPELILPAFVVSVVADVAKPETAPEEIAIDVAVTEVTNPFALTVIAGTALALPNDPVVEFTVARVVATAPATVVISPVNAGNLAAGTVPEDKLDAFNVLLAVLAVLKAKLACANAPKEVFA